MIKLINKDNKRAFITILLIVVVIVLVFNYKTPSKNYAGEAYSLKCIDSDGIDKNTMGIVLFYGKQYPDRCINSLTLLEFYCYNKALKKIEMYCDYKCVTGTFEGNVVGYCAKKPCSGDTKLCPDGTFVGRNPENNCEFYACPKESCPDLNCDYVVNEKDLIIVTNNLNKGTLACDLCDLNFNKKIDNSDVSIVISKFNQKINCAKGRCCLENCPDVNCNNMIDKWDMQLVTDNWGKSKDSCLRCDINKDNIININDLKVISNNYNKKTSEVCKVK